MKKIIGGTSLLAIILLAVLLRFYRINENLIFHGELGQNYLAIKDAYFSHQIPLLGPPTSHPWLSFGPLFYYIFAPFLILNNWNPNTGAYFFAAISIIGIFANYFLVKKYFNEKMALISSYLIAISPIWIAIAREARFFSMVAYLFYPFLYLVILVTNHLKPKYFFMLGFVFGVMLNFHLAPLFLIPTVLLLFLPRYKILNTKYIILGLFGFIIPNIPFLIYNFKTHFEMLIKFATWIPYRSVIYHNFNLGFTISEIYNFLGGLLIIPIIIVLYSERKNKAVRILFLFLVFGILALILHKDPPSHYFYVLYPIPIILLSLLLVKIKSQFLLISILFLVTIFNFIYLFSDKWFYLDENKVQNMYVPYKFQINAAKEIITKAYGRPFNLHRIGYDNQFEGEYAQNYKYLLWRMGNEPKDYKVNLSYTVIEK